jgi:hypothetical protein
MLIVTQLAILFTWAGLVAGQRLEFVSPSGGDPQTYTTGALVKVQWNTPFEHTNLELWQGPAKDGSFRMRTLLGTYINPSDVQDPAD